MRTICAAGMAASSGSVCSESRGAGTPWDTSCPHKWSAHWKPDLADTGEQRDKLIHTIGNLTDVAVAAYHLSRYVRAEG